MSTPFAAARLAALLAAVALLGLSGCGAGSGGGGERAAAAPAEGPAKVEKQPSGATGRGGGALSAAGCRKRLAVLLDPLSRLRRRLAAGLTYDQYRRSVGEARNAYMGIAVDRLPLSCTMASGGEAERALNKYIDAVNAWGECLADAGCDGSVVEPALQRKWRAASRSLSAANGEADG